MKKEQAIRGVNRAGGLFLAAVLLILAGGAWAQPAVNAKLTILVDQEQVQLGDKLRVTLEFVYANMGGQALLRQPVLTIPSHFDIVFQVSKNSFNSLNGQTLATSSTDYTLTATQVGTEVLGPVPLIYQDSQGKKMEVQSNAVTVTVIEKKGIFASKNKKQTTSPAAAPAPQAVPTPADELKGIKPLLPESHGLLWAFLSLALVIIGGYFLRRRLMGENKKPGPAFDPLGDPSSLRDAWKKLGKEDLTSKEFCLGLSNLVRACLQNRFQFSALDYTTEEILRELPKHKLTNDEAAAAEKCLKSCDRVLYADGNLTGRDNLRSLASTLLPKKTTGS